MLQITCTSCQASLSIDDAFAGGVCRCVHCGTIQAVPRQKRAPSSRSRIRPASAAAAAGPLRPDSGEEVDLAGGIATIMPTLPTPPKPTTSVQTPDRQGRTLAAISILTLLLVTVATVIWLVRRNG